MAADDPVHLSIPLRLVPGTVGLTLATDGQDSQEEIDACTFAILNTPLGWRVDLPEFGRPGQTFRQGGANLAELERTVGLWEPRADVIFLRESGALQRVLLAGGEDDVTVELA